MDRGAWWAAVRTVAEADTAEWTEHNAYIKSTAKLFWETWREICNNGAKSFIPERKTKEIQEPKSPQIKLKTDTIPIPIPMGEKEIKSFTMSN